ncbi:hypothetical protein LX16_3272 [Stackebrandtia albiflava]|uniref:Uncharacterized protein n=1 Tax=Stackebrandtia albiflava TaxID=406432 RepID=A0A562V3S6_9ACTN|nr:hypothetical protein [Stackebrandtia albiflava]TWJ12513.1 hypothetical protein LX16_3272 [Stackebrandtia albiflava]
MTTSDTSLPGVANPVPDFTPVPDPVPDAAPPGGDSGRPDSGAGRDDSDTGEAVVTEGAPRPVEIADHASWRDVGDNPWQADEDAPPPVIGE